MTGETSSKTETRFTKGPWRTDPECGNESVLGPDGRMVADCAIFSFPEPKNAVERNHANAHLIAAAPDLYAALGPALDLLVLKCGNLDPYANQVIADARAALAKARGEAVS